MIVIASRPRFESNFIPLIAFLFRSTTSHRCPSSTSFHLEPWPKLNPNLSSSPTLYAIPISSPCTHLCTYTPIYTHSLIISHCCCSLVTKSCPTRCNPMNCNPPDSFVHGIFQARILQWVAISFSRRSSWLRNQIHVSWIGRQILYWLSHMGSPIYHDSCLHWHLHNLRCLLLFSC